MENEEVKKEERRNFELGEFRSSGAEDYGNYTNITNSKELFNITNNSGVKLNDVVGEKIRFKKLLLRKYKKQLDKPVTDEDGVTRDYENKISTSLIAEDGTIYVTTSKTFAFLLMRYLYECNGINDLENEGVEIEIVKNPTPNGNKTLGFEVL